MMKKKSILFKLRNLIIFWETLYKTLELIFLHKKNHSESSIFIKTYIHVLIFFSRLPRNDYFRHISLLLLSE